METLESLKRIKTFPLPVGPKSNNIVLEVTTECALMCFTVQRKRLKMQLTEIVVLEPTLLFGHKLPSFHSFSRTG
jgi:hypothetical protein